MITPMTTSSRISIVRVLHFLENITTTSDTVYASKKKSSTRLLFSVFPIQDIILDMHLAQIDRSKDAGYIYRKIL